MESAWWTIRASLWNGVRGRKPSPASGVWRRSADPSGTCSTEFLDKNRRTAEEFGRLKKVFTQILSTGIVPPTLRLIEIPVERSDGTRCNLQLTASSIKSPSGYMLSCLFRDVTAENRMELALQEARAEAELANRAKSQFLARMSHEIRTPLHGITGLTELLSSTELTVEQHQYLDAILSSADLLLQVVNDILDFSKIESGRMDLEETPFDLRNVIERASDAVALKAYGKGIELVVHFPPTTPTALIGDPGQLQQVLVNLLNNAVKFTEKGQVVLRVRAESVQAETVTLAITLEDTGIGIAEEKLALIFESFRQSDDSTTRQYGGTGLGLPIASQLVELMGGRIQVESKLGQGSRFQFSITIRRQDVTDSLEAPSEWQDAPVLIIDDNGAARSALEEVLETWGLQVTTAEDGAQGSEALDRAQAGGRPFRLVLLDSSLPDDARFEAATAIKAKQPDVSLIILLFSAQIHSEIKRYQQLGVSAWLSKPAKLRDLRRAIETILDAGGSATKFAAIGGQGRIVPSGLPVQPLKILLADDNQSGLVIGEWMLKQLGHCVETASDGEQVLVKVKSAEFDLILMDLEMPHMDGWQALQRIRQREAETGVRRTPILAVTADASKGTRDAVLKAGMDGYLPKPFKMDKLQETLKPFLALCEPRRSRPVYDHSLALGAAGGSEEILTEVVEIFLTEDYPRHLQNLMVAIEQQDGELMRKTAHGLKGALATFGASAAADMARQLQEIAMRGEIDHTSGKLAELEREIGRFTASFSPSLKGSTTSGHMPIPDVD